MRLILIGTNNIGQLKSMMKSQPLLIIFMPMGTK